MRKLMAITLSVGLCAVLGLGTTGCGKKKTTTTPTTTASPSPTTSPAAETKGIKLSADAVTVETKDKKGSGKVKVTVVRTKVDDEIKLTFSKVPDGVEIKDSTIAEKKEEGWGDITVSDKAKAGEYEVTVSGAAGTHKSDATFKLTIKDKKAEAVAPKGKITLTADASEITIGKDKTGAGKAKISAKREDGADGAITLKFAGAPKGVELPKEATIKKGENDVTIDVKTAEPIKSGDSCEVTVSGTSGTATVSETKLKLTAK